MLILIGETRGELGASIYLRELFGREEGAPPPVDLNAEKNHARAVRHLIQTDQVTIVHDLSDGGLACAAADMALASSVGLSLSNPTDVADHGFYFGEDQARYLLAVNPDQLDWLDDVLGKAGVPYDVVGEAGGCEIALRGKAGELAAVDLDDLRKAHEGWMPDFMGGVD